MAQASIPTRQGIGPAKKGDHLAAAEAPLEDDVTCYVDAMHLEDLLGQVEADSRKLHRGWLP